MKKYSSVVIIYIIIFLLNVSFSYADIPKIVLNQKRAVVTIYVNDAHGNQLSSGTGFIINANGIIATNYHVVSKYLKDKNTLIIKMENGAYFPLSKLVNYDEENDVAIIKINGKELPSVKIAKNYKPEQGDSIVVVGSPFGLETTVSDGIISSIRGNDDIIQITASISPGSSGSPVFNLKGEVIGIATYLIKGGQNLNFAMPVKHIEYLLKGTKKPQKNGIINSEPLPIVTPAPASPYHDMTASDWVNKGLELWDGKKFTDSQKAFEYCSNAMKLNPQYALAYSCRGGIYNSLGQYQTAITEANVAIRLDPSLEAAYSIRGFAYFMLGNNSLGCCDVQKACSLGECRMLEWAKGRKYCR